MKKKLALFVSAMLLASSFLAGCGGNTGAPANTQAPEKEASGSNEAGNAENTGGEVVTLKAMLVGQPPNDEANVLKAVNEKLAADGMGIAISTTYVDDYWNKLSMAIAGSEEYDLVWAHASTISNLVANGVYQPIDDVFEQAAPDVKASIPEYALKAGTVNGKLYALPRVIPMAEYNLVYNIRGDLREKYGLDKITTLEGLEQFFDKVMENDPDMICTADHNMQPLYPVFANYYFPLGDGGGNPVYVDPTDSSNTVKSFYESEGFRAAANKKLEWRQKGYIAADESRFEDAGAGFAFGMIACVPSNTLSETERIDTLVSNVPGAKIETVLLNPDPLYLYNGGDNMLAVAGTSKHAEETVSFINWIKKDRENFDLWSYGVKGVNYNLDGEAISYEGIEGNLQYRPNFWMWNDMSITRFSKAMPEENITALQNWDNNAIQTPYIGFTMDTESIKSELAQLEALGQEYYGQLKAGLVEYDAIKDEFVQKLKNAGIDKIIAETQAQLDAYLAE